MKNISFYIIGLLFLFLPQFIHAQTTDTDVFFYDYKSFYNFVKIKKQK